LLGVGLELLLPAPPPRMPKIRPRPKKLLSTLLAGEGLLWLAAGGGAGEEVPPVDALGPSVEVLEGSAGEAPRSTKPCSSSLYPFPTPLTVSAPSRLTPSAVTTLESLLA
jgi:hypothetical protein